MMRSQKGITLIALVITIIVMLILVAVTITIAVNGGLFDYASKAATETNSAKVNEEKLGSGNLMFNDGGNYVERDINSIVDFYTE